MLFNALMSLFSRLPDGLTRRGDINLLMLGDPGTAKSQLLKFVERCSPIGVIIDSPELSYQKVEPHYHFSLSIHPD